MTDRHERECDLGGIPALCAPCARLRAAYERGLAEGLRRHSEERDARIRALIARSGYDPRAKENRP
jgi:hypothetical protein